MNYNKRPRRKHYFSSNLNAKKNKDVFLKPGMKGFLCTCNGNERSCIREAYNILNEYADKLYGEETPAVEKPVQSDASNPAADEDDELDEFRKEVESLKKENTEKHARFKAVDCNIMNCIFIKTTLDDPVHLAQAIMKDLSEKKELKARFLLRIVPIEMTCKANMEDLERTAGRLFDAHFKSDPTTYAIVYTKRANSSFDRDTLINKLATMVQERNPDHKVNLTNPEMTIIVELMKSNCALAVIKGFAQMSKYNLRQVCGLPADFNSKGDAPASSSSDVNCAVEASSNEPEENIQVNQEEEMTSRIEEGASNEPEKRSGSEKSAQVD